MAIGEIIFYGTYLISTLILIILFYKAKKWLFNKEKKEDGK